ncbi:dihydrolipoamide acetyltransferase family protein [Conexibacter stalactiti]|uniref:Dihydrolipoamide acetyltransferase component of pyruvate dehydrogenase complex n=1 Tax=Conexibacter stalactiti TaxID=1940611 RepID=A0ABU4HNH9_9ACTN|nr:dihydrolipoamide acetyltransferase family protein [Conexibacter stalactiti]MDW5594110.1 dihydrolipoamide acetyltransferase family protein [Conexibacter stalactiti]MEC5034752.1 dihydrolipoamide acetyltransferase family protein [Conexibacter stalactiti]
MPEIVMPRLSDSMEEGTIIRWLKADGDEVAKGEELVEIETDKANMTHEAEAAGALTIVVPDGETRPIGELIAYIGEVVASTAAPAPAGGRIKASPVARRIAQELGIDLARVSGSGPGGRIVKGDVERHGPNAAPAPAPAVAASPATAAAAPGDNASGKGEVTTVELSRLQQTVARRMADAKATVPDFAVSTDVDMAAAVALRAQLKALSTEAAPAPSFNDMVVKASAIALREHPRANGSYRGGTFELYGRVNVGIAVAAADALIVPTVFDADRKPLGQIALDARALAGRVRAGEITPPELSGGTFTISNLGMFGATDFTAIVNGGQAAILAVGALREEPVVADGAVVAGKRMRLTLCSDHRILNGADAAQFLARIRALLEAPLALLM